jgi:hypothetical protein
MLTSILGPYTINLVKVIITGNAKLHVTKSGDLRTQSVACDVSFSDMKLNFENMGNVGSIFQSFANSASNVVCENRNSMN